MNIEEALHENKSDVYSFKLNINFYIYIYN